MPITSRLRFAVASAILLPALTMSARVAHQTDAARQKLTLQVVDASGRPVTGLTAQDLTATVGGTPARILGVREAHAPDIRRLITVVVDEDTLPAGPVGQARLRTFLVDLIAAAGPNDEIAFVGELRAPMPRHSGFSRDREVLQAALEQVVRLQRARTRAADQNRQDRNRLAWDTVQDLAGSMADTPHDHRMLVVAGGQPSLIDAHAAKESGVAIYNVDLRTPRPARALLDEAADVYVVEIAADAVAAAADQAAISVLTADRTQRIEAFQSVVTHPAGSPAETTARALHRAVRFRVPHSAIAVTAEATPLRPAGDGLARTAVVLEARQEGGTSLGPAAHLHLVAFRDDDTVLRITGVNAAASGPEFHWNGELDLPTDTARLAVGVGRSDTGALGTTSMRLDMPDFAQPVSISGISVGWPDRGEIEARSALPFLPTLDRAFTPSDPPTVYARVFWRQSRASQVTLTVSIVGTNGDRLAVLTQPLRAPIEAVGDTREAEVQFPLPGPLPPGAYEIHLDASAGDAGSAEQALSFVVR